MPWLDVERVRDSSEGGKRRVHLSSFDLLPVAKVEIGSRRSGLDGQIHRVPEIAHVSLESSQKSSMSLLCSLVGHACGPASCIARVHAPRRSAVVPGCHTGP